MPQRKAFLMAGASLKWIGCIKRQNDSQWAYILTHLDTTCSLPPTLLPTNSYCFYVNSNPPSSPFPWSTTVLVQNITTRSNHSINTRKRNMMSRLLFAKYLLSNKSFLVPKFEINEAKPRKMTRAWVLKPESSGSNIALSRTLCVTIASY